jgi:glucosamine--fructose-6-phosphate aminotransferase (isomerizing)
MSHMLNEILAQPDIVARLAGEERKTAKKIAELVKSNDIRFVTIAARGTSDHAAIYGKYMLEVQNAMPVALADCSVFTLYDACLRLENTLVIGISQSGEATDVAEYLEKSKSYGALTLAITNEPGSKLTQIADFTMLCHAGKELGVAATKTYTSTLAALYLLSAAIHGDGVLIDRLSVCADRMQSALSMRDIISAKAERYRYMGSGYVMARGYNYCTALELALKLAETSYLEMAGYSAADFLHGPIAAVFSHRASR